MKIKLSIVIPTYNRKDLLIEAVKRLVPQLDQFTELLIIDNNYDSDSDVDLPVCEFLRYIKNRCNVGGDANYLKGIECARGEYVWLIGDDDYASHFALSLIKKYIYQNFDWICFRSEDLNQPFRIGRYGFDNLVGFLEGLSSINEIVSVSNNVFKRELISNGVSEGYYNLHMMCPHLVCVLSAIDVTDRVFDLKCLITDETLLDSISNNKNESESWPMYKAFFGIYSLYRISKNHDVSSRLKVLIRGANKNWLKYPRMLKSLNSYRLNTSLRNYIYSVQHYLVDAFNVKGIFAIAELLIAVVPIFAAGSIKKLIGIYENSRID